MIEHGFIGDIHGCVEQLDNVVSRARQCVSQIVFLGDYVNRGPTSREVIDYLLELQGSEDITTRFVKGNHDQAFLEAIVGDGFDNFLRLGGASTVVSYIGSARDNVLARFRASVPPDHVDFLQGLEDEVVLNGVTATHRTSNNETRAKSADGFTVYGHSPQRDNIPVIHKTAAFIDTGCGTLEDGQLTCLFWPSLTWIQSE
ncbi:hypothetical protein G6031_04430 [Dietzia sp. CQ4]|nr:hypothetical protein [Dietzia sp. CQ4]